MFKRIFYAAIALFAYAVTYFINIFGATQISIFFGSLGGIFENLFYSLTPLFGFIANVVASILGIIVGGLTISLLVKDEVEVCDYLKVFIFALLVLLTVSAIYSALCGVTVLPSIGSLLPPAYLAIKARQF